MKEGPKLVVEFASSLAAGGVERVVAELARGLDRARFATAVVLFDGLGPLAEELEAAGVPVRLLPRRPGLDGRYPLRLARELRALGARCLHAHNATALFYGALASRLAGLPCVYTEHDRSHPDRLRVRLLHRALAPLLARAVAVSGRLRGALLRHEGFAADRTRVVPNGVPPCDRRPRGEARAALGIGEGERALLWAGHFTAVKDPANLLLAFARIGVPAARLFLAGEGPLRPEAEALARREGIEERTVFLGLRRDLRDLYPAFDLFVLSSRSEGLPLAILEAMSAALPVVATDVGACAEVVEGSACGRTVPAGDPAALAGAIRAVLEDAAGAASMGERGRAAHRARYSLEAMIRGYEQVLEEALR
ncbi:MAG TPA: glycosyltransferase [Planctomycetota bacterium]|nr:glycosyltransferase [Planctomycetota bacterium]